MINGESPPLTPENGMMRGGGGGEVGRKSLMYTKDRVWISPL